MMKFQMLNPLGGVRKALDGGLFHLLGSNFLIQFLGFGVVLFLTKHLTPAELGELKLIQSYAAFFIVLGTMGYSSSLLKLCSEGRCNLENSHDFSYALSRVIRASIASTCIFVFVAQYYVADKDSVLADWMSVYAFVVVFAAIGYCFQAYLQSQKLVKTAAKVQMFVRLTFCVVIFFSSVVWGFSGVVIATILSYVVSLFFYLPYVDFKQIFHKYNLARKKSVDGYARIVFVGALVTLLATYADVYLLDYLGVGNDLIGLYSIATIFFMAGTVITGTVQTVVTPYFSERQDDLTWVRQKAVRYQCLVAVVSVFTAVALVVASWLMSEYYYGDGYELAFQLTVILMVKFFIWSSYSVIGACLFAIGVMKEGVYIAAFSTLLSVFSGYWLFGFYGVYGVACGQVLAAIFTLIAIVFVFVRKTRVECLA